MWAVILILVVLAFGGWFLWDYMQGQHSLLRNYPIIGRGRYILEDLGVFLRQYWFAKDWEERPFDRRTRSWVYRSAKQVNSSISFGSEESCRQAGTILFAHSAFPVQEDHAATFSGKWVGEGHCREPYLAKSFFNISGMSYGALSKAAVSALSEGAAMAGIWMNTGEGGLSPYHLKGGCDVVFQMGTAKYGVRDEHGGLDETRLKAIAGRPEVKMIEIKLSQGAKPGKGGILPGAKVTREISEIRGIPEGKASISPNRHPEIDSVGSLLDMIGRVREISGLPVGFKACLGDESFLTDLMAEIRRRGETSAPDFMTIDSADGGTGAAPQALADYVGLPINRSLPLVVNAVRAAGLDQRIKIIASGKLLTPDQVAWALATGADFVVSARGFMLALGCLQSLKCETGRCPTGVTSNDPRFMRGLDPELKKHRVAAYARQVIHGVEVISHSCGVADPSGLMRKHVRMMLEANRMASLEDLYAPEDGLRERAASE